MIKFVEFAFVAYFVATTVTKSEQIKQIFLFLGIGVLGQSLLAIAQFIKQGSLGGIFYLFGERTFTSSTPGIANASLGGELLLRPYGTFPHPNVLAAFLLLSMLGLLFALPWARKGFEKTVWTVALLMGSSALLLTMSRMAFLLWVVSLFVVFFQELHTRYIRIIALLLVAASFSIITATTPVASRLFQVSASEEAVLQRVELIQASWQLFVQQPLIGVGLGNFLPLLTTVQKPLTLGLYVQPVHNIFLLVLVETGLIGLGFLVWFLVKTYRRLFGVLQESRKLLYRLFGILLTVVLVLGSIDHYFLTLQQGQLFFALILGLSWTRLRGY